MWHKLPITLRTRVRQQSGHRLKSSTISPDGMKLRATREYELGDSPRHVSLRDLAKFDQEIVVEKQPDRNALVVFLIDISASEHIGSERTKHAAAVELVRGLGKAFLVKRHRAIVIAFTTKIEFESGIISSTQRFEQTMDEISDLEPSSINTDPKEALDRAWMLAVRQENPAEAVCIISDFLYENFHKEELGILSGCADSIACIMGDPVESAMPPLAGGMMIRDSETGDVFFAGGVNDYDPASVLESLEIDVCRFRTDQTEEDYFQVLDEFFTLRQKKGGKA